MEVSIWTEVLGFSGRTNGGPLFPAAHDCLIAELLGLQRPRYSALAEEFTGRVPIRPPIWTGTTGELRNWGIGQCTREYNDDQEVNSVTMTSPSAVTEGHHSQTPGLQVRHMDVSAFLRLLFRAWPTSLGPWIMASIHLSHLSM